jgi:hypothetical protein
MASLFMGFSVCFSQSFSLGVLGGVRTTDDFPCALSASKRYVIGPAVDIGLPRGFGIDIAALYRREGYNLPIISLIPLGGGTEVERANSWEFPILAKYTHPLRAIGPFVESGYAPRVMRGSYSQTWMWYNAPSPSTASVDYPVSHGFVAGAGVRYEIGHLRLLPAVRYTHWNNAVPLGSSRNQLDALVGIGWKLR